MKQVIRAAIMAAALLVASVPQAFSQEAAARTIESYGGFDGRWEGVIRQTPGQVFSPGVTEDLLDPPANFLAFSISNAEVKVYTKPGAAWVEMYPGHFRLVTGGTNAVLFCIAAGTDSDGGWVETSNFTITHKERDSLNVVLTRAVNNFNKPSDYFEKRGEGIFASGRFFQIFSGEMTRVDVPAK